MITTGAVSSHETHVASASTDIAGRIRRRLLLTYRVDPSVARAIVPAPFRPQLVDGSAVAGICMIGLTELRPAWLPPRLGFSAENAAHRFAVEWDDGGVTRQGVYITGRHSAGLLPVLAGGRLFPGVHRRARFDVDDHVDGRFRVRMQAADAHVAVDVQQTQDWSSSLFASVDAASDFYRTGAIGWSPRRGGYGVEAIELAAAGWAVEPGRVNEVSSSFFDSLAHGAAAFDSALIMRDVRVTWKRPDVTRPR